MSNGGSQPDNTVTGTLALNAIQTAAAVFGVRREMSGSTQRWKLAHFGAFELDNQFAGLTLLGQTSHGHQRIATTGRLWSPDGMAVVSVEVALETAMAPPTKISIRATSMLPPYFVDDAVAYRSLAKAAITELGEELLYHASTARRTEAR